MRPIDADVLIADLEYDVQLDIRLLDDTDYVGLDRTLTQFDKDCKQNAIDLLKNAPTVQLDYKTDHGYMWLCPKCGLVVHSDFIKCPRCGLVRHDTQQEVGITRCMYCKNWIPGYITDNDEFIPPKCGKYQQMVGHSHNDFCSLAERRTDDEE